MKLTLHQYVIDFSHEKNNKKKHKLVGPEYLFTVKSQSYCFYSGHCEIT